MKLSFALAGCAALFSVTQPADARLGSSVSMNTAGMRPFLSWLTKGSFGSSSNGSPPPASRPGSRIPAALLMGQTWYFKANWQEPEVDAPVGIPAPHTATFKMNWQEPEVDAPVGIPAPHTATSFPHFVDSGDSCYALHFAGAPISFTPQMIHTCPAPVCSPGTNNCALATLPLVAPLDLQAAGKQARASEMSRAGLLMLKRAFDSTRVVRDWERLEATMVCVEKEPAVVLMAFPGVLFEGVTPWVEFFGSVSLEAFDWLSDKATSSVRSVICLCRQFSFYDMPARTTRPKDIPNSTFAEILERYLLRKAFADALLAGWIGLRWCLVSADHRVRLFRSFDCMRRRSSRNGYRLYPKDHGIVASTVRRMKRLAVLQNVDKYLSVSQLLLLNPSSTLEDVDRMMTRLDGRLNREREQAFHCHMRLYADSEGLFAAAMEKMLLHEAKVKAHVRQEFADAKVAIREEVRQELRREMKDHTNYVDKLNSQLHANFEQLLDERSAQHRQRVHEEKELREQATNGLRQQFAAEMQDLRRQSAEALANVEARAIAAENKLAELTEKVVTKSDTHRPTRRGTRGGVKTREWAERARAEAGEGEGGGQSPLPSFFMEEVASAETRIRRESEEALVNVEARLAEALANAEARLRQESMEAVANAESRIRRESAEALANAEARAIAAENKLAERTEQAVTARGTYSLTRHTERG